MALDQTLWNITNHTPTPEQITNIEAVRADAMRLAAWIHNYCPDSREKSLALTKLEETVMWAVASIARDQPGRPS